MIRGVPDLVLMMLLFFGGQIGVNAISDMLYYNYDIDIYINFNALPPWLIQPIWLRE